MASSLSFAFKIFADAASCEKGDWEQQLPSRIKISRMICEPRKPRNFSYSKYLRYTALSNRHGYFEFSGNEVSSSNEENAYGLYLRVDTPNVQMILTGSNFKLVGNINITEYSYYCYSLHVNFTVLTNNSYKISNSSFQGDINLALKDEGDLQCSTNQTIAELSGVAGKFFVSPSHEDCRNVFINIEYSNFSQVVLLLTNGRLLNTTISNRHGTAFVSYFNNITFVNCTIKDSTDSAIVYGGGHIFFQGYNIFKNNTADFGGALRLYKMESMNLLPHTTLLFVDNHAKYVGGAINSYEKGEQNPCFYNITSPSLIETVKMVFINNTASYGGSSLYGGGLEQCSTYDQVINVTNTEEDPSAVAAAAHGVCFCEQDKNQPNCSRNNKHHKIAHVFPGQDFTIRLATVTYFTKGDAPGVVPGAIRAYSTSTSKIPIKSSQVSQASDQPCCHNVTYSVNTTQSEITFSLSAEQIYIEALIVHDTRNVLSLTVNLDECPLGFNLSSSSECECDQVLLSQQVNVECDVNNQSFLVPENSWIGFINKTQSTNMTGTGVIFHPNCPFGYCLPHNVSITSSTGDDQCEPHRTGMLCGKCQEGCFGTVSGRCSLCS